MLTEVLNFLAISYDVFSELINLVLVTCHLRNQRVNQAGSVTVESFC